MNTSVTELLQPWVCASLILAINPFDSFAAAAQARKTTPQTAETHPILISASAAALRGGNYRIALEKLRRAAEIARHSGDTKAIIDVRIGLGLVWLWTGKFDEAEFEFRDVLRLSMAGADSYRAASLWNNLGNLSTAQKRHSEAVDCYEAAVRAARESNEIAEAARARANLARLETIEMRWQKAQEHLHDAHVEIGRLPAGWEKAELLIHAAQTSRELVRKGPGKEISACDGWGAASEASAEAESLGDARLQALALGLKAEFCQAMERSFAALRLARRAAFQARQADAPDLLADSEWQTARLWRNLDEPEFAISAYQRAVTALTEIRHDLAVGYGNTPHLKSFQEGYGALYFELADLLLKASSAAVSRQERQRRLAAARDTVELLRSAELEDYFRDECVSRRLKTVVSVDSAAPGAAVIYLIPLADRLEVLISRQTDLERVVISVPQRELIKTAAEFRYYLEKRTTYEFRKPAQRLYRWLIEPILHRLTAAEVNTLVWVPVGGLRSISISALQHDNGYLVEQYALAFAPSLSLMDPRPLRRQRRSVLIAALTQPVSELPALPYVQNELEAVQAVFSVETMIDERFNLLNLEKELKHGNYSLVHIASHAQFDPESKNSFIESHGGKIGLDDLERLIRPSQYRGSPIELLVLSACQTATGDDRAALGLAGIALKSGARSALASLWNVNDEATALLLSSFYRELEKSPDSTKAQALQRAQLRLMNLPAFRHPYYWSSFILIGNWL